MESVSARILEVLIIEVPLYAQLEILPLRMTLPCFVIVWCLESSKLIAVSFQVSSECDQLRLNLASVRTQYEQSQIEVGALQGRLAALQERLQVRTSP